VKTLLQIAAIVPIAAFAAAAQDDLRLHEKLMKEEAQAMQMRVQAIGAVKGMTVKGAPYSGEEVNETNHVLGDGTRIHRETRATVYRDSEGRTRRETPENITITDPVGNVTYILNPKTMTGQKLTMAVTGYSYVRSDSATASAGAKAGGVGGTSTATFSMKMESDGGTPVITVNGQTLDPKQVQELIAKAKTSGDHTITVNGLTVDAQLLATGKPALPGPFLLKKQPGESLGKQMIEGVNADGNRTVNTIKAGSIGNDRDIQVTGESWYSPELQTTIMSKHSDPRTGEESFRLTNINRNEPGAYLFQPPAGYTINERK
jgi:hypothetical protein